MVSVDALLNIKATPTHIVDQSVSHPLNALQINHVCETNALILALEFAVRMRFVKLSTTVNFIKFYHEIFYKISLFKF
jgi:hypothetical protein